MSIRVRLFRGRLQDLDTLQDLAYQNEFITGSSIGPSRVGLDTMTWGFYQDTADAVVEAGSTDSIINITGHSAQVGDMIRVKTSAGGIITRDYSVLEVTANTITLAGVAEADFQAGDTVDILKGVTAGFDSDGNVSVAQGAIQFTLDGSDVTVNEDTVTPANNRPLPVKLTSSTGDINITANDLHVQLGHTGATPDSVQVGDGTEILQINASGEAEVSPNGTDADNAAVTRNPILVGAQYLAAAPTYDDGDQTTLRTTIDGTLVVTTAAVGNQTVHDLDTGAGTEENLGVSLRLSANGGSLEAKGQMARADSIPMTLSTEDITLITQIRDRLPAALGQLARAASLGVTLSTEDIALITQIRDRLPASLGQLARAASLGVTLSTEDIVLITAIRDRLPASLGQLARAASFGVTLSTEDITLITEIRDRLPATLGQLARAASLGVTLSTEDITLITSIRDRLPASLGSQLSAASLSVTLASDEGPIDVNIGGSDVIDFDQLDFSSSNVTDAAYTELTSSLSANATKLQIFTSTGVPMFLAVGAAASETDRLVIFPGGFPHNIVDVDLSSGDRISLRSARSGVTVSNGEIIINYIG